MAWQPTTVTRIIKGFPSSAKTALVETDIGLGYLKAMGGPEGPHTLAAEVLGTQLANWFGLSTFDWALIQIDECDEIPFMDGNGQQVGGALPGPAFISRSESGEPWGGGMRELELLVNPEDVSRLVVFDTWTLNCDRHSIAGAGSSAKIRRNRGNVFLSEEAPSGQLLLKAMDHTHCFSCGAELTKKLGNIEKIQDDRIFGCFREFRSFLNHSTVSRAVDDLRMINRDKIDEMIQIVPKEWDVSKSAWNALTDLIIGRANFVAESFERRLWPQGELFHDKETGEPES